VSAILPTNLSSFVQDFQAKVLEKILEQLKPIFPCLLDAVDAASEVDCLLSLAITARELNWVRPAFDRDCCIDITEGRNPLAEALDSSFVPNSSTCGKGEVHLVTGPNLSGKSVYLKQVNTLHP